MAGQFYLVAREDPPEEGEYRPPYCHPIYFRYAWDERRLEKPRAGKWDEEDATDGMPVYPFDKDATAA